MRLVAGVFGDPCLALYHAGKAWYGFGHDMGRGRCKIMLDVQLMCVYKHYGVKACLLHHILDYITHFTSRDLDYILSKIEGRFGLGLPPPKDVDEFCYLRNYPRDIAEMKVKIMNAQAEVLEFVKKNIKQILKDVSKN